MSVSIFVPPNRTIGCYTGAILPPSLPFNLSNYTFTPFIPLFPEASSGCPGVWHFPWVSDEGGLVWAKSRHFAWFMSACCHASVTQTQDKAAAPFYTCVCDWVGVFPEGFHCVFVCVCLRIILTAVKLQYFAQKKWCQPSRRGKGEVGRSAWWEVARAVQRTAS